MNNVFSFLPYNIKQYVIAPFLGVADRVSWNQVLSKDERVVKKFDKDYPLRHRIAVLSRKFNSMRRRLNLAEEELDESGFLTDMVALEKSEKALLDICKFCKSSEFEFLAKYSSVARDVVIRGLEFYSNPDFKTPLYHFVPMSQSQYLAGCAALALNYISFIQLVSDTVGVNEHRRMLRETEN